MNMSACLFPFNMLLIILDLINGAGHLIIHRTTNTLGEQHAFSQMIPE